MIRQLSEQELHPPKPVEDPMRAVSAAITRLAGIVAAVAQQPQIVPPAPEINIPAVVRPVRLEAEVVRDKAGRMQRIVVTPVY